MFLRQSLLATGAAIAPLIVPARVLGRGGGVAPSNQITLGGIGIGPRGRQVLASMIAEKECATSHVDVQAALGSR